MFDSVWDADQAVYFAITVAVIAGISVFLVRKFRRSDKPWPTFFVGLYVILLLLAYLFGLATRVTSEGFGYIPIMVLATPWSWLGGWILKSSEAFDSGFWASGPAEPILFNLLVFVLPGTANSCILYFLLKRHKKKHAEDEAWEQARRNR